MHVCCCVEKTTTVVAAYIYLMSAPEGNSQFCFPESLKNIAEIQGETKLTVSRAAGILMPRSTHAWMISCARVARAINNTRDLSVMRLLEFARLV
jgi:hypothetical protein